MWTQLFPACVNSQGMESTRLYSEIKGSFLSCLCRSVFSQRLQGGLSINRTAGHACLSLYAFSSVAPISLVLCFWNSSHCYTLDQSFSSAQREHWAVWFPIMGPFSGNWEPPGSFTLFYSLRTHFVSLFSDHRPAPSASQRLKNIVLCILSTF